MRILLSIRPEHAENILNGRKQFEFRKAVFKHPSVRTAVIYATKPLGKIVGEFDIEKIISDRPGTIWHLTSHSAGISHELFVEYFDGKRTAFAIKISKARRYKQPLDLRFVLPSGIAPQSFCYLS
jgi:predicted transcriptional regulator